MFCRTEYWKCTSVKPAPADEKGLTQKPAHPIAPATGCSLHMRPSTGGRPPCKSSVLALALGYGHGCAWLVQTQASVILNPTQRLS